MNRVAVAIARAIDDGRSPTLEELASAAALSPFHFHRVYRLLTGETAAETARRLRLARALQLVDDGISITRAAHEVGYGSSQSLAKAVRKRAGASISELRSDGHVGDRARALRTSEGGNVMAFELVDHSPVRIACRCVTGPYAKLNLAYQSLFEDFCGGSDEGQIRGVYGVPLDDPREVPEDEHRFIAALAVSTSVHQTAPSIDLRQLGGGSCAVARFAGPYRGVPQAIDDLYAKLIEAGRELRDAETFLHYLDQPGAPDGEDIIHESDIYVPIA